MTVDGCMLVILQHQLTVLRDFNTALTLFEGCPPEADPVPTALQNMSGFLAPYTFRQVNEQWECYQLVEKNWIWF